jgi:hypothetical protein
MRRKNRKISSHCQSRAGFGQQSLHSPNPCDDRQGVQARQDEVRDPSDRRRQDEGAEHHQAGDHDVGGGPDEERLVDREPADLTGLEVGPEVAAVRFACSAAAVVRALQATV